MTESKIEWTDRSDWNPIRGCTRVSEGCRHCYAETMAARFSGEGRPFHDYAKRVGGEPRWTGKVELLPDRLDAPLRWRKPAKVFACSMSDLFHEALTDEEIAAVFDVMRRCLNLRPGHRFQVLTKRPRRMAELMPRLRFDSRGTGRTYFADSPDAADYPLASGHRGATGLTNLWLGVSVEDQATADERIPLLLQTPAAVRWVSYEPALAGVDFVPWLFVPEPFGAPADLIPRNPSTFDPALSWIVVGGESGPGARTFDIAWARSTVQQGREAGVPVFVKQLGARPFLMHQHGDSRSMNEIGCSGAGRGIGGLCHHSLSLRDRKGGDPSEWPEDLRVREFPSFTTPMRGPTVAPDLEKVDVTKLASR